MIKKIALTALTVCITIGFCTMSLAQKPYRVGTTTANFLEIGLGASGNAMGDAQVANTNDLMSVYWNPAGLAFMNQSEAQFIKQPYVADINMTFAGVGLVLPQIGTLAMGITHMGYGDDMAVTTLERPDGTGEKFGAKDVAFTFSVARRLVQWFSFGASGKYIHSQIWHTNASALATDLGAIVHTQFFSSEAYRDDGLKIGMSISNYGTRMAFEGMDLLQPIDPSPSEQGNYAETRGAYKTTAWELPLIFRIGIALTKHISSRQNIALEADALHPNNNSECINLGAQYTFIIPGRGEFFLCGGYKGLGMSDSIYGSSFGGGFMLPITTQLKVKLDFAYRSLGLLGNSFTYGFGLLF